MKQKPFKKIAQIFSHSSNQNAPVTHFAIDSRMVQKGSLFFAIKGVQVDGHEFLQEAAAKGAIGAMISKEYSGEDFGLELIKVENVRESLQTLAKISFAKRGEKVVGITGSMGKTTTKEFLATLLEAKYKVEKTQGNFNSQLMLPITLLNLEEKCDILVLEMAMSQKGHIEKLVQIAPPDIAVVTRIAPAGIKDFVGGLQAISQAKGEIFSHPKTHLGVISYQAAQFEKILYAGNIPKWIYGWKEDFEDARLGDFVMKEGKNGGVLIEDSPEIFLSFQARHLRENFLAAAVVGRALGLSWKDIKDKAKELKPVPMRFEVFEKNGITFVRDCYNANPESMKAALKNLPKTKGKTFAVLGSMVDVGFGEEAIDFHKEVGQIASNHLDHLFCIGENAKYFAEEFSSKGKQAEHFSDIASIKKELFSLLQTGDVVLIKGGNAFRLWELLED